VLAAIDEVARRDLFSTRQLADVRPAMDRTMGEELVDDAIGVGLDRRREKEKILAAREVLPRQGRRQEKALKVMRVKVSFTPASVWILLVTKWPMSVLSSR
jgi:hypothetical protein